MGDITNLVIDKELLKEIDPQVAEEWLKKEKQEERRIPLYAPAPVPYWPEPEKKEEKEDRGVVIIDPDESSDDVLIIQMYSCR